jgi:hypothetical protein
MTLHDSSWLLCSSANVGQKTFAKLKEMKLSDFIDVAPVKELESEGFFTRMQGS